MVSTVSIEPTSYSQAINSYKGSQWQLVIQEELNSHVVNATWSFT